MIRILIIELIMSGVIGAVFYRLAWAFTSKHKVSWSIILIIMTALLFFVPGSIDEFFMQEYGGISSTENFQSILVKMIRSIGLIVGAGLATIVVVWRNKKGLGQEPPFKDFP